MNRERMKKNLLRYFFLLNYCNRSILMFHSHFIVISNIYIFISNFFSYNQYLSFQYLSFFISEKRAFCNYSIFSHIFFTSLKHTYFFSDGLSRLSCREMLVYNFFSVKFYFHWTILATRVYKQRVYYITWKIVYKYLINCCVLTWFILFWINGRDTLLL